MAVRVIADAVELQVGVTQACFESLGTEFLALSELYSVGGSLDAVIADFAGEADGVQEARTHGWFAAGELYGHLAARLDLGGVLEDFLNFFPVEFVDVTDLIGVHEAGVAHHVETIGEVNSENRAAAVADCAGGRDGAYLRRCALEYRGRGNSFQSIRGTWNRRPLGLHICRGYGILSPSRPGHRAQ